MPLRRTINRLFSYDPGRGRTATVVPDFHAIRRIDGTVDGHYQVQRHLKERGGTKQHGRIVSFSTEGNQAWLGAIRENTAAVTNEGSWTGFRVVDNGEGGKVPPDLNASLVRNTNEDVPAEDFAMAYCANKELVDLQVLRPIVSGNIQIHRVTEVRGPRSPVPRAPGSQSRGPWEPTSPLSPGTVSSISRQTNTTAWATLSVTCRFPLRTSWTSEEGLWRRSISESSIGSSTTRARGCRRSRPSEPRSSV